MVCVSAAASAGCAHAAAMQSAAKRFRIDAFMAAAMGLFLE
jgi:hypothetical protein